MIAKICPQDAPGQSEHRTSRPECCKESFDKRFPEWQSALDGGILTAAIPTRRRSCAIGWTTGLTRPSQTRRQKFAR